jgi:protein-L-isoaspartate(D-aspartate) O-methyltransferase
MVETIVALARSPSVLRDSDGLDASILGAMREVPRHALVPEDVRSSAYANRPLPIGYGQTISQPFIVALMTDLARPDKDDVVLEIGTGSGYQAAVLSRLVSRVYSIEIVEPLVRRATERLHSLGYNNITVRQGDGYHGWPEHAPFDAVLVTAAASHIPPPLVGQLKPGGRMVIPVGPAFMAQNLMLVEKDPNGKVQTRVLLPVSFVPLTGSGGR